MAEEKVEKKSKFVLHLLVCFTMLAIGVGVGLWISNFCSDKIVADNLLILTETELFVLRIDSLAVDNQGEPLEKFMDAYDRFGYRTHKESGYILVDGEKVDREWMYIKLVVDIDEGVILPDVFHNRYFPAEKVSMPVI